MTDFAKLIEVLAAERVDYIIVGGLAATAHGSARLTQDIDAVYARSTENLDRISTRWLPSNRIFGEPRAGSPSSGVDRLSSVD